MKLKVVSLIFMYGCGLALSSAQEGKTSYLKFLFGKELISFLSLANV